MKSATLTDSDIRALGWQALVAKLGPTGALRFTIQTERGYGDYAETRHRAIGSLGVAELLARMRAPEAGRRGVRKGRPRRRK